MLSVFPEGYGYVAAFAVIGLLFGAAALAVAWLLRPSDPYEEKLTTYECGLDPLGQAWAPLNFHYYIFCLIFVIFDVEMVFLYPWAVIFRPAIEDVQGAYARLGLSGEIVLIEMLVFLVILLVGFGYAWRKGALRWV